MLTGFQVGCQLGTGPTEAEHHLEQGLTLLHAPAGAVPPQRRRGTYVGKQIDHSELTP
jgi:hypothetical protein